MLFAFKNIDYMFIL